GIPIILVFVAVIIACCNARKPQHKLDKCAYQVMRLLDSESNVVVKEAVSKTMQFINEGATADAQAVGKGMGSEEKKIIMDKYLVDDCRRLKSCLECLVEL
ncbi:hypothetical protein PFISCL1PPCAC_14149, partial [Pristionchus fissidentatus]